MAHDHSPDHLGFCSRCATPLVAQLQEDRERPTCPACGFVVYVDPKVAVAVVLGDDARVLLVQRGISPGKGLWSLPAGYVNRGEILEEAAIREVKEELGVVVNIEHLVGVYSDRGEPVILVVYAGCIVEGDPTPDHHEVIAVRRFHPDQLPPMAFPHDTSILHDWLTKRAQTAPPVQQPSH